MQIFKIILKRLKERKIRLIIVCLAVITMFAYLGIKLLGVTTAEVLLAELKISYEQENICHETCSLWRRQHEQKIVLALKSGSGKIEKRLEKYWQSEETSQDFKYELLRIMALAYGENNPPPYIKKYLNNSSADMSLLREIIVNFNSSAINNKVLEKNIKEVLQKADDSETQIEAIKTLKTINSDSEIANYFKILVSSSSLEIKLEIIKNISNIKDKQRAFNREQVNTIRTIALLETTDIRLRQELTLLLGDYYLIFSDESARAWEDIYNTVNFDAISRSFAADNLNHLTGSHLELPIVDDDDWTNYYKQ